MLLEPGWLTERSHRRIFTFSGFPQIARDEIFVLIATALARFSYDFNKVLIV